MLNKNGVFSKASVTDFNAMWQFKKKVRDFVAKNASFDPRSVVTIRFHGLKFLKGFLKSYHVLMRGSV